MVFVERIVADGTFIEIERIAERVVAEGGLAIARALVELTDEGLPFGAGDDLGPFSDPPPAPEPPVVVVLGGADPLPPHGAGLRGIGPQAREPEAAAAAGEGRFVKVVGVVEAIFVGGEVGGLGLRNRH